MDRFHRLELLIGEASVLRLGQAHVAVFGVGGVGSYAVEALARAGVGHLTLIDFDQVCITNINRQIQATDTTVGQWKVEAIAERCRAINPNIEVSAKRLRYDSDTASELLGHKYDYVLDCIDMISSKLHLIQSCCERKLPIISSMGAANKLDPAQIHVADISATKKCRLARTMRRELRKREISKGVDVVFSTEEFRPLKEADTNVRRPTLGSSSYIPPIFGLTMAAAVIRKLIGEEC
jgi:tRNA threonylcarbamoyladenosine dehydratase